jgi:RNA polymerase sigma-70 factor, ECF subfamily
LDERDDSNHLSQSRASTVSIVVTTHPSDLPNVEPLRARLFGIAYRMLGDAHESEDLVQEAYLRWHRADRAEVANAEAWLVAVVTRLSIDRLRRAEVERLAYVGPWLPEPIETSSAFTLAPPPTDRGAELASDLSMALLVLLERLAPDERAAFLLRDVFDALYDDIVRTLERNEPAVRQLVHRARERVRAARARFNPPPDARERLLRDFLDALAADDQAALLALFDAGATFTTDGGGKVSAARRVVVGAERIVRFLIGLERKGAGLVTHRLATLNGEQAVVSTVALPGTAPYVFAATAFVTDGERIHAVDREMNPDKLRRLTTS